MYKLKGSHSSQKLMARAYISKNKNRKSIRSVKKDENETEIRLNNRRIPFSIQKFKNLIDQKHKQISQKDKTAPGEDNFLDQQNISRSRGLFNIKNKEIYKLQKSIQQVTGYFTRKHRSKNAHKFNLKKNSWIGNISSASNKRIPYPKQANQNVDSINLDLNIPKRKENNPIQINNSHRNQRLLYNYLGHEFKDSTRRRVMLTLKGNSISHSPQQKSSRRGNRHKIVKRSSSPNLKKLKIGLLRKKIISKKLLDESLFINNNFSKRKGQTMKSEGTIYKKKWKSIHKNKLFSMLYSK